MKKFIVVLSILLALVPKGSMAQEFKALVGGRLIDGFGKDPVENSIILIEGDKIIAVGHAGQLEIPEKFKIISTEGMTVLPGLWDMHLFHR